jgi:hypothetical protein
LIHAIASGPLIKYQWTVVFLLVCILIAVIALGWG